MRKYYNIQSVSETYVKLCTMIDFTIVHLVFIRCVEKNIYMNTVDPFLFTYEIFMLIIVAVKINHYLGFKTLLLYMCIVYICYFT